MLMRFNVIKNTVLLFVFIMISCGSNADQKKSNAKILKDTEISKESEFLKNSLADSLIVVGANRTDLYLPILSGKRIGVVANQSSVIFKAEGYSHLIDSLLSLNVDIKIDFSPEHGFRGKADAGEVIKDGLDPKTGLPIVSLYGDNKKPKLERLAGTKKLEQDIETGVSQIDLMIFDLQDVGARFYTYISTLHYVMEACAENNIPLLILDRPNPNGHYIDGPILELEHKSFLECILFLWFME